MESEKDAEESTANGSNRDDILRREIVKNLAESLLNWVELLRELSNDLEFKAGIKNSLHEGMSEEELSEHLYDLVRGFSLIRWHEFDLKEFMELNSNERGLWALEEVMSNISNEDSS